MMLYRFENKYTLDGSACEYLRPAILVAKRHVSPCGYRALVKPERQLPSRDQRPVLLGPVSDLASEGEFGFMHLRKLGVTRRVHFCNNAGHTRSPSSRYSDKIYKMMSRPCKVPQKPAAGYANHVSGSV